MLLRKEVQSIQCLSLRLRNRRDTVRSRQALEASESAARILNDQPLGRFRGGGLVEEKRSINI